MGMDKNTLIGFGLIAALLIAMFAINSKSRLATEGEKKRIADSVAAVKAKLDSNTALLNKAVVDTNKQTPTPTASSPFQQPSATETFTELQNDLMIVRFSNKGGQPVKVTLKKFKTAVLVDRNHKKYPIKVDFKGISLSTTSLEHVSVVFEENNNYAILD
jgi:pyrimidine operon attenuation protein/uracil phosphoribosyltransferase